VNDFDAALGRGGSLVAAWDDFDDDRTTLTLFEVGPNGARQLADTKVAREAQQKRADELVARGVRIGYTVGNNEHVWAIDEIASVWSSNRVVVDGNRTILRLAGDSVATGDVRRVIAFYNAEDRGRRGVRLETARKQVIAAEEHDDGVRDDPFYNQDNLVIDAQWASYLANDLATWLGVPLEDQLNHIDNASQLRIAKAAREVAEQTTPEVMHSIGFVESLGELKLRRAASSAGGEYLEVIVAPKGGKVSSRWLRQGTRDQIVTTLRSVRLPRLVLDTASAILDQERDR
jgi:hypothetical protein